LLHQVGDLFELNVKLGCQKVKENGTRISENKQGHCEACEQSDDTCGYRNRKEGILSSG
jgi:hypothetical protein